MDNLGNCCGNCGTQSCDVGQPVPRYGKVAPTEEAHLAAMQLRETILKSLEAAMDNDWVEVKECCDTVKMLAEHCFVLDNGAV